MKFTTTLLVSALAMALPLSASAAAVTFKNKSKKSVEISIRRSNSSMPTTVPGGVTIEFPGAPMKISLQKKSEESIEAGDGEIVVYENGKLTKEEPSPEAEAGLEEFAE